MYNMDLTSSSEKSEITVIVTQALQRLSLNDRRLPQVLRVKDLVKRGIGLHHAGMLPLLKEMVEIVFSRGLVKVLFATETFAMGVNTPTKTVVFYSTRKHDGEQWRELLPGEYTQMSGRAGRRGLDKFGIVIINAKNDEVPDEIPTKYMLTGRSTKLESRFRLTYNMILNLLRQEDLKVEDMIRRSFGELISARDTPRRKVLLLKGEAKLRNLKPVACKPEEGGRGCTNEELRQHVEWMRQIQQFKHHLFTAVFQTPSASSKLLSIGRAMILNYRGGLKNCVGVILKNATSTTTASSSSGSPPKYLAFILIPPAQALAPKYANDPKKYGLTLGSTSPNIQPKQSYVIGEFGAEHIVTLLTDKLDVDVAGILVDRFPRKIDALCQELVTKIQDRYGVPLTAQQAAEGGIVLPPPGPTVGGKKPPLPTYPKAIQPSRLPQAACIDPMQDLRLTTSEENFALLDEQYLLVEYEKCLASSPVHQCPNAAAHINELMTQHELRAKVETLRSLLSNSNLDLIRDFEVRMKVLQTLRYVDVHDRTVQLKGRVACELNTCDSLIVTELIFENILTRLENEEIVALLSCLIFQEKNADEPQLPDRLLQAKATLDTVALRLGQLQLQCGMDIVPEGEHDNTSRHVKKKYQM